jgi:hypothetical protein
MDRFKLGQPVKIVATGRIGTVISIWESLSAAAQFMVRFFDSTDRPCDFWFYASDLETA